MFQTVRANPGKTRRVAVAAVMVALFLAAVGLAYAISRPLNIVQAQGLRFQLPRGWTGQSQAQASVYKAPANQRQKLSLMTRTLAQPTPGPPVMQQWLEQLVPKEAQSQLHQVGKLVPRQINATFQWLYVGQRAVAQGQGAEFYLMLLVTRDGKRYWAFYLTDRATVGKAQKQRSNDARLMQTLGDSIDLVQAH